uniref:Uncharacterized protein n=1 Tax=Siphoviridae sp. ctZE52 TaxID=2825557 RepID=A0A8S5P3W6_9CAUD|nr:MAG TPA: hypothetical protein [Siphoviridae sp. ctZE52]
MSVKLAFLILSSYICWTYKKTVEPKSHTQ